LIQSLIKQHPVTNLRSFMSSNVMHHLMTRFHSDSSIKATQIKCPFSVRNSE